MISNKISNSIATFRNAFKTRKALNSSESPRFTSPNFFLAPNSDTPSDIQSPHRISTSTSNSNSSNSLPVSNTTVIPISSMSTSRRPLPPVPDVDIPLSQLPVLDKDSQLEISNENSLNSNVPFSGEQDEEEDTTVKSSNDILDSKMAYSKSLINDEKSGETVLYSPRLDFELSSAADNDDKQNSKAPIIVNQSDVRTDNDYEGETEKPNTDHNAQRAIEKPLPSIPRHPSSFSKPTKPTLFKSTSNPSIINTKISTIPINSELRTKFPILKPTPPKSSIVITNIPNVKPPTSTVKEQIKSPRSLPPMPILKSKLTPRRDEPLESSTVNENS